MYQATPSENNVISNEDIYQLLQTINTNNTNIEKRLERIESNLSRDVKEAQSKLVNLEEENKILKEQILETQKRQKKFNIVIYGIAENETDIYITVQEIVNTKLEIHCELIEFRDIHRLGKEKQTDKARPILVELVSYKKKIAILKGVHKLKGTGIFISNDLTTEELKERKILLSHLKQAREKKYNAKIYKNKLIINGETYSIENLQGNDQVTSDTNFEIQEIPTTSKRNSNSTPSTPTYYQKVEEIIVLKEKDKEKQEEKRTNTYNTPNRSLNSKQKPVINISKSQLSQGVVTRKQLQTQSAN